MTTKTTTLLDKLARNNHIQNSILFHGPNLDNIQTEISYFIEKVTNTPQSIDFLTSDDLQEPSIDILLLNPSGTSIKIDMIKSIQERTKYGPSHLGNCIIIIHNIARLTQSASNALLKSIEEPSQNTVFIFTTQNKESIIPTILSRCQHIFIPIASTKLIETIDKKAEELSEQITFINAFDFLKLSTFEQCIYIQSLPYTPSIIEALLTQWKLNLFKSLSSLEKKERIFLEKIIEIISKIKYNFNLKLQLSALIVEIVKITKED